MSEYLPGFPDGYNPQFPGESAEAPLLVSALIVENWLYLTFDQEVEIGAGGDGGFALTASGGAVTATYDSGEGTDTLIYALSRYPADSETITIDYTQPGDGVEGAVGQGDLASFSGESVAVGGGAGSVFHDFSIRYASGF